MGDFLPDPLACPHCGLAKDEDHRCRGWSTTTAMQPLRKYRDQVQAALDAATWGAPVATRDGTRTMREAWVGEWHLGLEEGISRADSKPYFRGMAECEDCGVRVRLSPQQVDQIRSKVGIPQAAGRSE